MPKPNAAIAWIVIGGLLSTTLPGCAPRLVEVPGPAREVPVVVKVKDPPPAELLRCPDTPEGFPLDQVGELSTATRAAAIRIGKALGVNAGRLRRLVNWIQPGTCPAPAPSPTP
jgi:hypothetical protein